MVCLILIKTENYREADNKPNYVGLAVAQMKNVRTNRV